VSGQLVAKSATFEDAAKLQLREIDKREIAAVSGLPPEVVVEAARLKTKDDARALYLGDELICIGGIAQSSLRPDWGTPWLLGSDRIDELTIRFAKVSRQWADEGLERFRVLHNFIHVENETSIRWLRWLGFSFFGPFPYGRLGEPFYEFMKVRE